MKDGLIKFPEIKPDPLDVDTTDVDKPEPELISFEKELKKIHDIYVRKCARDHLDAVFYPKRRKDNPEEEKQDV